MSTGVKAYTCLSILEIDIQTRQYVKVRTTGPCSAEYAFSSNIKPHLALHGQNRQLRFFLGQFIEFKLHFVGIQLESRISVNFGVKV